MWHFLLSRWPARGVAMDSGTSDAHRLGWYAFNILLIPGDGAGVEFAGVGSDSG